MDNGKLGVLDFGRYLLDTGDLDPVYIVVEGARLPRTQLNQWLVAYWCFYSVGTSSVLSEAPPGEFFRDLERATPGTRFPRGTERRHFRGAMAEKAARSLRMRFGTANSLVTYLTENRVGERMLELSTVMSRVESLVGFGPWIAFKVADMLERLAICRIAFKPEDVFRMFETPRKGAGEVFGRYHPEVEPGPYDDEQNSELWSYKYLERNLDSYKAPPLYDRQINIQEVETILCKWKSHLGGHYPPGKDTREIREALLVYGRCKTSQKLLRAGREKKLW